MSNEIRIPTPKEAKLEQHFQEEELKKISLSQIAMLIYQDWRNVSFGAKPYLSAMLTLQNIKDTYYQDSGASVVAYFLANASRWKGPFARLVKKELNRRLKES